MIDEISNQYWKFYIFNRQTTVQMGTDKIKIVIFGAYNAGKSSFIRSIDPQARNVDTNAGDVPTTVALDFGRVFVGGKKVYLFGTPGQERFEFVREILSRGMHGAIVIVDTTREPDEMTRSLCTALSVGNIPYAVFLNKCDHALSSPHRFVEISSGAYTSTMSALTGENAYESLQGFIEECF